MATGQLLLRAAAVVLALGIASMLYFLHSYDTTDSQCCACSRPTTTAAPVGATSYGTTDQPHDTGQSHLDPRQALLPSLSPSQQEEEYKKLNNALDQHVPGSVGPDIGGKQPIEPKSLPLVTEATVFASVTDPTRAPRYTAQQYPDVFPSSRCSPHDRFYGRSCIISNLAYVPRGRAFGLVENVVQGRELPIIYNHVGTQEGHRIKLQSFPSSVSCDRVYRNRVILFHPIYDDNLAHAFRDNLIPLFRTVYDTGGPSRSVRALALSRMKAPFLNTYSQSFLRHGVEPLSALISTSRGDGEGDKSGVICFTQAVIGLNTNSLTEDPWQYGDRGYLRNHPHANPFVINALRSLGAYLNLAPRPPAPAVASGGRGTGVRVTIISRQGSRTLLNEMAISQHLRAQGYEVEVIDFARLSLSNQAKQARETDILIGVGGAGLTNAYFMQRGVVVELKPLGFYAAKWWDIFPNMFIRAGLSVIEYACTQPAHAALPSNRQAWLQAAGDGWQQVPLKAPLSDQSTAFAKLIAEQLKTYKEYGWPNRIDFHRDDRGGTQYKTREIFYYSHIYVPLSDINRLMEAARRMLGKQGLVAGQGEVEWQEIWQPNSTWLHSDKEPPLPLIKPTQPQQSQSHGLPDQGHECPTPETTANVAETMAVAPKMYLITSDHFKSYTEAQEACQLQAKKGLLSMNDVDLHKRAVWQHMTRLGASYRDRYWILRSGVGDDDCRQIELAATMSDDNVGTAVLISHVPCQRPVDTPAYAVCGTVGTDKDSVHHYAPYYQSAMMPYVQQLRRQGVPVKLLEIGMDNGASIYVWRQLLGPQGQIYGIDNDKTKAMLYGADKIYIGDQEDDVFLTTTARDSGPYHIIIDDGGHYMPQQRASLSALLPFIVPGGLYIIEDVHTSYDPAWGGGYRLSGTTMELVKCLLDVLHIPFIQGKERPQCCEHQNMIQDIRIFPSMVVITKLQQ